VFELSIKEIGKTDNSTERVEKRHAFAGKKRTLLETDAGKPGVKK